MRTNFKFLATMLIGVVLSSNVWGETIYHETFGKNETSATIAWGDASSYLSDSKSSIYCESTGWKISKYTSVVCDVEGTSGNSHLFSQTASQAFVLKFGDLSGYTNVTLTLNWKNGASTKNNRTLTIKPSANGGTSWGSDLIGSNKSQSWQTLIYNIPEASLSNFAIEITNTSTNDSRIDDIKLAGEAAGPSCTTDPTVSAGAISGATTNSLTFNCSGGITNLGSTGCSITEYGYVYGTSSNPTTSNTKHKVGESYTTTGTAFAAHTATGLNCGTTYYMRPYAINGNGTAYGTQATLSTSACLVDHFIDNVQETDGYTGDGKAVSTAYTKASITLSDKAAATSGSCEEVHYHFVGWVTAANRSEGYVDAEHIVNFQDSGNVPTGTTYYAVWAAEQ